MKSILEWLFGGEAEGFARQGQWRLEFVAEHNNYVRLALLAAMAAMVYLAFRSYMREGTVPRRNKLTMAGLRIAVILLAFMVLFRPAMVLRYTRTLYSSVVVLMDDSMSMGLKDHHAQEAYKQPLASRLGTTPSAIEEMSRLDLAKSVLTRSGGPIDQLAKDHPLAIMSFPSAAAEGGQYLQGLGPVIEPVSAEASAPGKIPPGEQARTQIDALKATGEETHIPAALRGAVEYLRGRRGAIVLVSDGRNTAEGASGRMSAARELARQRGVDVYALKVGEPTPPKNLAVVGLSAPRTVRVAAEAMFIAKLTNRQLGGQRVTVKLQRRAESGSDWMDLKSTEVELARGEDGGSASQEVELAEVPAEIGNYVYRVTVDKRDDEQSGEDNTAETFVNVVDRKIKVLLVSSGAGNEYFFLKNYLVSQPEIYRASLWQQNADPEVNQAASDPQMRLKAFPNALETILGTPDKTWPGYDVVMLYDPMPSQQGFDPAFAANLKTAVEQHGLGLIYIAGKKYTASTLDKNSEYAALRDLLPVFIDSREIPEAFSDRKPEPWPVVPTGYGLEHPAMNLGGDMEQSGRQWTTLPGIFWAHALQGVKPVARVLAESGNPMRRLASANQAEPLVVAQPLGRGRVLYMDFDETWRWRSLDDMKYYRRFWSNVIQHLAPTSALQVIIATGGTRFPAGRRIDVDVEAYDDDYKPLGDEQYVLKLTRKGDTAEPTDIRLQRDEKRPGRYKGEIPRERIAHVGTYVLTPTKGQADKIEPKELQIVLPQAEMLRSEADWVGLDNTATRSQYSLPLAEADQLSTLIPPGRLPSIEERRRELWDSNAMLVLLVVLLTVEWILRKKHNLA